MGYIKYFRILSYLALYLLSLHSCDFSSKKDSELLIIGTSADNPPYEFIDQSEVKGFDIDVINAVAKDIGYKIEIQNMDFYSLIPSLLAGKIDLAIAGLSVNQEREKIIDFSLDYAEATPVIIYNKDLVKNFSVQDIYGKKIAAQVGSIFVPIARDFSVKYQSITQEVENLLLAIQELLRNNIQYLIIEQYQAKKFVELYSNLDFQMLNNYQTSFAIAMRQNFHLKDQINKAIVELKDKSIIYELTKKWRLF